MSDIAINNPFVVGKYLSDKYFCDRTDMTNDKVPMVTLVLCQRSISR